jgi:phosphofructokinase-like protein
MNGSKDIRAIGVLTSGGDCAGLNAAIRAVTYRAAVGYGWKVYGIEQGTAGLMERPVQARALTTDLFDGALLRSGGTFLGTTNRGNPFAFPRPDGTVEDRSNEVVDGYRSLGLDALIAIGGDGSQAIIRKLAQQGGMNLVCIPKTIDNDIGATEVSIGYDTAVQVASDALDKLQPTAASHSRIMILEVMGRDAGHIALASGIAGGADIILIPEISYTVDHVVQKIEALRQSGRNFALIVVAEACPGPDGQVVSREGRYGGVGHALGAALETRVDAELRVTVLGHLQRGGQPSPRDRLMATVFGTHAVDLVATGRFDRTVVWRNRQVEDVPIEDAIATYANVAVDGPLVRAARALGVSFGDTVPVVLGEVE